MKEKNAIRVSFHLERERIEALDVLAAKRRCSRSELIRGYIERGLTVDGQPDHYEEMTRLLERVIDRTVVARIERHIGLTVKGIIASAAGYFLTARVLESMVPPEHQQDYREALAEARRRGIDYVKLNAREMEEQLNAGLILPDDQSKSYTDNM